jgi:hypothetical protein
MMITPWEPRVTAIIEGRPISFLLDIDATFLAFLEFWGPTRHSQTSIVGVEGTPTQPLMTFPLNCMLGGSLFTHSFLILPNCPTPLLGQDILSKFQATLTLYPLPFQPQPTGPLPPFSQPFLAMQSTTIPQTSLALPDPLPLPSSLVDPVIWDLQSLLSLHTITRLSP